jgi:hypothetical protein
LIILLPLKLYQIIRIDLQPRLYKIQPSYQIQSYSLFILHLLILIIFNSNLSIYYFHHHRHLPTLFTIFIINIKPIYMKKIFRFYFYLTIVQCLKLFNLIPVLMFTNRLEPKNWLRCIQKLYRCWPYYLCRIYVSIFFCLMDLMILFYYIK